MYAQLCLRLSEEAPNFDDPGKTGNSVNTTLKVITKKIVISVFTGRFLANIFLKKHKPCTITMAGFITCNCCIAFKGKSVA